MFCGLLFMTSKKVWVSTWGIREHGRWSREFDWPGLEGAHHTTTLFPLARTQSWGPPRYRNDEQWCLWLKTSSFQQLYAITGEHKLLPDSCPFCHTSLYRWDTVMNYMHKYLSRIQVLKKQTCQRGHRSSHSLSQNCLLGNFSKLHETLWM